MAKHQHGYWFAQGKRVTSALIQAIGGKYVLVTVEGHAPYDRIGGTVTCKGKDVGEWLVRNGYGIAAANAINEIISNCNKRLAIVRGKVIYSRMYVNKTVESASV